MCQSQPRRFTEATRYRDERCPLMMPQVFRAAGAKRMQRPAQRITETSAILCTASVFSAPLRLTTDIIHQPIKQISESHQLLADS
jgi:hypothetical protein